MAPGVYEDAHRPEKYCQWCGESLPRWVVTFEQKTQKICIPCHDKCLDLGRQHIKALQSEIKALKDRVESLESANEKWAKGEK